MRLAALVVAVVALSTPVRSGAVEVGKLFRGKDVTLWYDVRGTAAGTPLVVINGGPGIPHTILTVSDVWDHIARRRRVILYDQRGVGRSPALTKSQSCTLADQIEDLDALRASLGFERVDVLGHSWGGYLAMAYAARHPEHVAKLIICDSAAPKWSDTVFLFKDIFPETTVHQQELAFAEELGDTAAAKADFRLYFSLLCYSPAKREALVHGPLPAYDTAINKRLNDDLARYDLNPELPKFRMPTLVLTGRYDINVAPSVAWKIHQAIPGSEFAVFEMSGHLPWYEEPDLFQGRVERFLGQR
jgi:proline iminopeptidase